MTTVTLDHLAATQSTDQGILGHLFCCSISDTLIKRSELESLFIQIGIPLDFMPNYIKNHDAFRRASTAIERKRVEAGNGQYVNLLVREVKSSNKEVVRHIVLEHVDSGNVRLNYDGEAARLHLDKVTGYVQTSTYTSAPSVVKAIQEFHELYDLYSESYDGTYIRRLVSDILQTMAPQSIRKSGGVYIVPIQFKESLDKLVQLILSFRTDSGERTSQAYKIPLIDTRENRDMIRERVALTAEEVISRMTTALRSNSLTKQEIDMMLSDAKLTIGAVKEYEKALEESMMDFSTKIEILQAQMMAALEKL